MSNGSREKKREIYESQFIDLYFQNGFNATRAVMALKPKLKENSARTEGWQLLTRTQIREEIDRRLVDFRARRRMTVEQIGDLLQDFSTVDVLDIFTETGDLRPLTEIPPHARRVIQSIEVEELWEGRGEDRECIGNIKKIKLVDKKGAAELLGKYKKMFTDKIEATGADGGPLKVSVVINAKGRK